MRIITDIVIHCSATRANVDEKITWPGEDIGAAEITKWHIARGFRTIGYHLVIRRSGLIEPGRPLEQVGAHVGGHNVGSLGICLVGGISETGKSENNFEPAQWAALKAKLLELKKTFPGVRILGHRDYPGVKKACPCFDVGAWAAQEGM
jgi:N-acetylmuramoyl-L-alanine amidase